MLTFRLVIPLLGVRALLAAACNDDEALASWCVIKHHEALPQELPGYQRAIAVDGEGRVHVAAPSLHIVREPGGSWSREEEAFGAGYFGEVALAASGPGVVVAHTADGLRVARGASGAWTTLFDRSYEQCSGHPYVERVEAAEDGAVLLASSEGLLRLREGADPEPLPYAQAWTADGAGLLTCATGDDLRLTDGSGEVTLPHAFSRVLGLAAAPQGGAGVLLARDDEGGVWLVRRDQRGAWDAEPTQLAAWTDVECPDDPQPGARCSARHTRADVGNVLSAGGSLLAFVVLKHGRADLTWGCAPVIGPLEYCYRSWQGDWTYERELWIGDLSAKEPALRRVKLPEGWDMKEERPVAAPAKDGSVHVLVGSSYARIDCPH